ncbi:hypothetical protein ACIA8G_12675 [Lentzea sp. NPDC051213]|uniref:hypothetical protein n=1 Tax=Lentzea sp. NPDC051213 TaxID=3364126 RepID=UPI00379C63E1
MQTEERIDLFSKPANVDRAPTVVDGSPPRGLTSGGWVRTTGWLQVGDHPVSSAHLAAVVGLLWAVVGAAALVGTYPVAAGVLVLTVPVLCGVSWSVFTGFLRPASRARNVGTRYADELAPGDVVRLHGSIGPIGQVTSVTSGEEVLVDFHGGEHRMWAPSQVVHVAELLS